jgi:tellurite resistance protein
MTHSGGATVSIWKFFLGNKKHQDAEKRELAHLDLVQDAMVKAMAAVAFADGNVDNDEIKRMGQIYNKVTGNHVESSAIRAGIQIALENKEPIETSLGKVAGELEPTDKANIIHAGALIALANDVFDASEKSTLRQAANAMGVGPESFNRIIERAKNPN